MGYVESNLKTGEQIVHKGTLHWAIYLPGMVFAVALIGFAFLADAWVTRRTTEMVVTNIRVFLKTGWLSRKTIELNLGKVETVSVDQGILGRLLGYGTITVVGTGGTHERFKWVTAPLDFRRAIQAQVPTTPVTA
jgi:uncharacterized membrane protein YdbT with pleckstrin-like domain